MASVTVKAGESYTLPACGFTAPEGKQFKAWSVNGKELAAGEKITVNGNVKITAVWENVSSSDTLKTTLRKLIPRKQVIFQTSSYGEQSWERVYFLQLSF